jgi:hypothetical protein
MQRTSLSVLVLSTLAACGPTPTGESTQAEAVDSSAAAIVDCRVFDGYTAALGTRAVDCLGTVGPDSFFVDKNGNLRRNFDKCPVDERALTDIDDLLGIQVREKEQEGGKQCIAGRWLAWQREFVASGTKICPTWKKTGVVGTPTARGIDLYSRTLPQLPAKEGVREPAYPKVNSTYALHFEKEPPPEQKCRTPADCGRICVGGFPGAFVGGQGETATLDPLYWLVETDYTTKNPFMRAGYYHAMSFYGSAPGELYGHRNREAEACSRYFDGMHYLLKMELDCIAADDLESCMTSCGSLAAAEAMAAGASP